MDLLPLMAKWRQVCGTDFLLTFEEEILVQFKHCKITVET